MEVTENLKRSVAEIAKRKGLALVLLFGSQATGNTHKFSDIDIGYISRKDLDYKENYSITIELAQVFKNKNIEFTNIYAVPPSIKKQISDTGIILYEENPSILDYFKIHALREYLDTKPLRVYRDNLIKDFIKIHA